MINVCCVRVGDKYGREYVAVLHNMVVRSLGVPFRFWCITDDPEPIHPDIEIIPHDPDSPGWWQKINLFSPYMPWDEGDRIVYFDLDVAIVGRLEELVETKGIILDWNLPCYNSSVMVWDHGEHRDVWDKFMSGIMRELPGDQDWLTKVGGWDYLPRDWCLSYRGLRGEFPPRGSKVIVYHGKPDPHECTDWTADVWKIGGLTELPVSTNMNVTFEVALSNMRENSKRDLPWFIGSEPHKDTAVLIAGGPSLKDHIEAIRAHKQRGARIIALNNTAAYLNTFGIIPDTLIIVDARPENVIFTRGEAKRYLIASQCDPSLFDALEGKDVHVWHAAVCDEIRDVLEPYWETHPVVAIGGGGTVGLRAINVAIVSGYRKLHLYGYDSSYTGEQHHAYRQSLNDLENVHEVFVPLLNKTYLCAIWMSRQAAEFRDLVVPTLRENKVKTFVHGSGLIPDMWRALNK
jgi:hypothetical protein